MEVREGGGVIGIVIEIDVERMRNAIQRERGTVKFRARSFKLPFAAGNG